MSASIIAARGNRIFPVETFGDTLIVLPKGDKAGFGEADFRVECGRVAAALRDPKYKHLVLDFSLTNYVGGNVVEELQKWVDQVRGQGGRAVACEVSDDMRKGLEVSRRAEDWQFFETRDDALKEVAHETPGQTFSRWAPTIATVVTVLLLVGLGAWLLSGRREETRRFVALEEIWKDYAKIRDTYQNPHDWKAQSDPLVERLDAEILQIRAMLPSKYAARNQLLATANNRMKPILLDPRKPDPRARGVEAGFAMLRANLAGARGDDWKAAEKEYLATAPARLRDAARREQLAAEAARRGAASTADDGVAEGDEDERTRPAAPEPSGGLPTDRLAAPVVGAGSDEGSAATRIEAEAVGGFSEDVRQPGGAAATGDEAPGPLPEPIASGESND